ncbi:MAG: UDP-glucose 4-epimerase GalE [Candidatus Woesearchaeota archaeon]
MKLLVTGGAGYIGSHTVRLLIKEGYELVVFDSLENGHKESLPENVELIVGNLSDTDKLNEVFKKHKIDAVMHFAGYIEAGESMKDPLKFFENNFCNGMKLVKAMLANKVDKIIFSSSAAVYGNPKAIPITEDSEKIPTNYYGRSKLMFEQLLDACKVNGLKSISLRYFNAAGAAFGIGEDHDPETHLIPLVLEVPLGKREHITIFGTDYDTKDGTCVRDYIHVLDLARAHVLALKSLLKGKEGKYNLGSEKGYSVKEVIAAAAEVTGKAIKAVEAGRREGDPPFLIASSEKIKKELGWKPEYGLRDIIKSAWDWHKSHPEGF